MFSCWDNDRHYGAARWPDDLVYSALRAPQRKLTWALAFGFTVGRCPLYCPFLDPFRKTYRDSKKYKNYSNRTAADKIIKRYAEREDEKRDLIKMMKDVSVSKVRQMMKDIATYK